jgi:hypothetical protein
MSYRMRAGRVWDDAEPIRYGQMSASPAMAPPSTPTMSRPAAASRGMHHDPYSSSYIGTPHAVLTPAGSRGGPVGHPSDTMLPTEQVASAEKEQCAVGDVACLQRNMMRSMPGQFSTGGPQSPEHVGGNPGGFRVT